MSSNELMVFEQATLSVIDVQRQVNLIQEIMGKVMKKGEHYGVIPGCGTKPTLLKAGAEKIISAFRLCPDFVVDDLSVIPSMIRYRIKCELRSFGGVLVGAGLGECSSMEEKYFWKKAEHEYSDALPEDRRIKKGKYGESKQVKGNCFDVANTILKMAKKRALVDACLTTTAASDIFTQDIEDIPLAVLCVEEKPIITNYPKKVEEKPKKNGVVDHYSHNFEEILKLLRQLGGDTREGMQKAFHDFCTAKHDDGKPKGKVSDLTVNEQEELIESMKNGVVEHDNNFEEIIKLLRQLGGDTKEGKQKFFDGFCKAKHEDGKPKEFSDLTVNEQDELIKALEHEIAERQGVVTDMGDTQEALF